MSRTNMFRGIAGGILIASTVLRRQRPRRLAGADRHHRHAVCRRRHRRRGGAAHGGAAAIDAEAEFHRREPDRRRRHRRAGTRRQGHAGRLHADVDADLPAHHGEVRAQRLVRREQGLQADLGGRLGAVCDHGRRVVSRQHARRIHRLREGKPGQAHLRLGRRRQHHACRRGGRAQGGRPRHGPRAVSRRGAGVHRSAGRPHRDAGGVAG